MLLFNLYCLLNPAYVTYNFDYSDKTINAPFAYPYAGNILSNGYWVPFPAIGSDAYPEEVEAFSSITSSATLTPDAHVKYHAGKKIHLTPGFNSQNGSVFHAKISPLTCDIVNGGYKSININQPFTNGGNDYPVPLFNQINKAETTKPNINNDYHTKRTLPVRTLYHDYTIRVFPNPAQKQFTIQYRGSHKPARLTLRNLLGQTVMQMELKQDKNQSMQQLEIPVYNLAAGSYTVNLETDGLTTQTPLVIY